MLVFVIECEDLGDLEGYFLWKEIWVGLRQGLMLCQRPLEVLSYWSLRTYRIIRSKISCKLFWVMQFPLPFTNLQENLPKTPAPCVNSSSLTVEQQNASPCGPIQLVDSLLIQRNQLLEPTPTNTDCGKKPCGFPLCVRDELKRCPFSSLEFGGLSVAFAVARVIVEWDEKEPYLYHLEWSLGACRNRDKH